MPDTFFLLHCWCGHLNHRCLSLWPCCYVGLRWLWLNCMLLCVSLFPLPASSQLLSGLLLPVFFVRMFQTRQSYVLPVKKNFQFDAKLGYGRPLAGHELIECRSIYDAVDMCGGGTSRQEMMKMEIFDAGVESREANSLDGVSTTSMSTGWQSGSPDGWLCCYLTVGLILGCCGFYSWSCSW